MSKNPFSEHDGLRNLLFDAVMSDGHAPYPAGSLLLRPPEGAVLREPLSPQLSSRFASALLWMATASDKRGAGGKLGSLVQRSAAGWLDRNGLSEMGMTSFVEQAFALASSEWPRLLPLRPEVGETLEVAQRALSGLLRGKAKHWQARRVQARAKAVPQPPRLLAGDTVGGAAFLATARQMTSPQGKAELLARYSLKILSTSTSLNFDDWVSLKQPLLRAWTPLNLSEDLSSAAKTAWLGRVLDQMLHRRESAQIKAKASRQMALFDPWSLTDSADLGAACLVWVAMEEQSGCGVSLPLSLDDVWSITHTVLRAVTDPVQSLRGQWTLRELAALEQKTLDSRNRRTGRDGTSMAVLSPVRKLMHDHACWLKGMVTP